MACSRRVLSVGPYDLIVIAGVRSFQRLRSSAYTERCSFSFSYKASSRKWLRLRVLLQDFGDFAADRNCVLTRANWVRCSTPEAYEQIILHRTCGIDDHLQENNEFSLELC